jgi:hypothetical protein
MFESTRPGSYGEDRKAKVKNHNLPILQYMYMGSKDTPLTCLITKTPAFIETKDFGNSGFKKRRFRLDFNHIRQLRSDSRHSGISLDKSIRAPSDLFRTSRLDHEYYHLHLIEFMTIIPICTEIHSYISQDSAKHNITLNSFDQSEWPWVLQSPENFYQFLKDLKISGLNYEQFIDHLSNINHPSLQQRLHRDFVSKVFCMVP